MPLDLLRRTRATLLDSERVLSLSEDFVNLSKVQKRKVQGHWIDHKRKIPNNDRESLACVDYVPSLPI